MPIAFHTIERDDDPRLDDFRDIRDRDARGEASRPGLFVGEQLQVIERMLAVKGMTKSIVIAPRWRARLEAIAASRPIAEHVPAYVVASDLIERVAGFHIHRGAVAVGYRPPREATTLDAAVPDRGGAGPLTLLIGEDITNIDNIGGLFRDGAAFGVDAVVLSPACHDPLYRKSIRVSIGHVLTTRWARCERWPDDIERLKREWGITLIAATTDPAAKPIDAIDRPGRVGVVVGSEFSGLSDTALSACDLAARIPMAVGVDSLNVSVAAAVMLHRFSRAPRA
jgi:tRNA G18 (ribose-2'-O)-methylase SpoU